MARLYARRLAKGPTAATATRKAPPADRVTGPAAAPPWLQRCGIGSSCSCNLAQQVAGLGRDIQRAPAEGGTPLPDGVQRRMEQALGSGFSAVRVHTGPTAHRLTSGLQARAFTSGRDVFFRAGAYNPGTQPGDRLLAHELTHVVQQAGHPRRAAVDSGAADPLEAAADAAAQHAVSSPHGRAGDDGTEIFRCTPYGGADGPREREADGAAERILTPHARLSVTYRGSGSGVRRKCAACQRVEEKEAAQPEEAEQPVDRRPAQAQPQTPARASTTVAAQAFLAADAGRPLDSASRAFFEHRFGYDFAGVRVHNGAQASDSARSINAVAYTIGHDIAFRAGAFAPGTNRGRKLLAHELAHVVQQGASGRRLIQRQVDVTRSSVNPAALEGLDDSRLHELQAQAASRLTELTPGTPEYDAVGENVQVLGRELAIRATSLPTRTIPRPAALPADEGFMLTPAQGIPSEVVALIPEGIAVTMPVAAAQATAGAPQPSGLPALGASEVGAKAFLDALNTQLRSYGFVSAGDTAVGIVAIRQPPSVLGTPLRITDPAAVTKLWGHTAIYVRTGGRITHVYGFSPTMAELIGKSSQVEQGTAAVTSRITSDAYLFEVPGAHVLEYPVSPQVAQNVIARITPGEGARFPKLYTARPSRYLGLHPEAAGEASNCGLWACGELEAALGGKVGRQGPRGAQAVSLTEATSTGAPTRGTASQRILTETLGDVAKGEARATVPPRAIGEPVAGGMEAAKVAGTTMRVLKVGGRVMFVVSLATIPLEVLFAPTGRRARTFLGASAGFAGGFAGGALAGAAGGLVCGPGAPVCVFVLVLVGGAAGYFGARGLTEYAYDVTTEFYPRQVASVIKEIGELLAEYDVILGALDLAKRSDPQLSALGATAPATVRENARRTVDAHRLAARDKEQELLRAFEQGYDRARTSWAGLKELDRLRNEFLQAQRAANPAGEELEAARGQERAAALQRSMEAWRMHPTGAGVPPDVLAHTVPPPDLRPTQTIAAETFARIETTLAAGWTVHEVEALEQWDSIDSGFGELHTWAFHSDPTQWDAERWDEIAKRRQELTVMMRNARYRLDPTAQGGTGAPLLKLGTAAYIAYESRLEERERRFVWLNARLLDVAQGGGRIKPSVAMRTLLEEEGVPATIGPQSAIGFAENAVGAYEQLLAALPPLPADIAAASPTDLGTAYNHYVEHNPAFATQLVRLEASERMMISLLESARDAQRSSGGQGPTRVGTLIGQAGRAVQRRRDGGYLYTGETKPATTQLAQAERAFRIRALAQLFGEGPEAKPLGPGESMALQSDELKQERGQLGLVSNQLARMTDLPTVSSTGWVRSVYRVTTWRTEKVPPNALVGGIGPGTTITYFHGHEAASTVIPLNRAAVKLFGDVESREIERRYLQPVTRHELAK
jgi:Domain of unknown function (DUF4157)